MKACGKGDRRDIIAIGGSAGSIEVLEALVRNLPATFGAAVFVVVHSSPRVPSRLPAILNRLGPLKAEPAIDGESIRSGRIYLPPPDRDLVIAKEHICLTRGPKEGLHPPSINMTFRSAALTYGNRVVGVLLSGMLNDGTSGLWEIAKHGGVTVVQDPAEAQFPSMPLSAVRDVPVDYRVRTGEMGDLLTGLAFGAKIPPLRNGVNWQEGW